ncbi:MAG: vWA domain-containing protein [Clostridiaceae bacterium]
MSLHKRFLLICTLLLTFTIQCFSFTAIHAAGYTNSNIDAVLVVDDSASMRKSDPDKISLEAMKMFIDMISLNGDQLGIISYTGKIMREKPLLPITNDEDKKILKEFVSQMERDGLYTDIAAGVTSAVRMLDKQRNLSHKPMIIVFTDGKNDLDTKSGRTMTQSNEEIEEAIKKGYPIYTVGLNADSSVDADYLKNLSDSTGARSFITKSANDLPDILSRIFADHMQLKVIPLSDITATGEFQDIPFSIPDSNVLEANICLLSQKPVEIRIYDPHGQQHTIPGNDIYYSKSSSYSMIKLIKPAQGDWKLQAKGINGEHIKINLLYNYDVKLTVEPLTQQSFKKGDKVRLIAYFESNGQRIPEKEIYKDFQAKLQVNDITTGGSSEMAANNMSDRFEVEFTVPDDHKYQLIVKAEGTGFFRESSPIDLDASVVKLANPISSPMIPVKEEEKSTPFWVYPAAVLALLLLGGGIFLVAKNGKKPKFVGQVIIEIKDDNTGKMDPPQFKKLTNFTGKVTLHQLLQLSPEFMETEKIVLSPGKNDRLILKNASQCDIHKGGRVVNTSRGYEIIKGDRLMITMRDTPKSILLEYIH